jgi:hypothetical protein
MLSGRGGRARAAAALDLFEKAAAKGTPTPFVEHTRCRAKPSMTWHFVPVLDRKPGALRAGAAFRDWLLPAAMERVQ